MRILIINAGSSSIKFNIFDMKSGEMCFKFTLERINSMDEAQQKIPEILKEAQQDQFDAIGHRVGHGGEKFKNPSIIDEEVIKDIEACIDLAPLHNPPCLQGINMARKLWNLPQVAVFDTSFHQTMPLRATTYAVPEAWRDGGFKRYGFHGTSHHYIMEKISAELQIATSELKIISCHLGNGSSVCAIKHGKSIDTSMGLTPLEGLVMGTRCGDVDPGLFNYISRTFNLSTAEIEKALYRESGLLAISGISSDLRDIEQQAILGNKKAQLAIEIYAYKVKKYIGSYAAAMGGLDVLAFTGGVGENSSVMRDNICNELEFLGINLDKDYNKQAKLSEDEVLSLHQPLSKVKILITRAHEQWMIAKETYKLIKNHRKSFL